MLLTILKLHILLTVNSTTPAAKISAQNYQVSKVARTQLIHAAE
jgi:hypothetical protein